jgi:glutamate formiminotransferase / 5-formyltetrahydrofolate cyclo-ligase
VIVECVINVSEGRDEEVLAELTAAAGAVLLDTHRDPHHHRAVLTRAGSDGAVAEAARRVAESAVARLDLTGHGGAHPRLGVLDVVPFTPYHPDLPPAQPKAADMDAAVTLRDDFARWLSTELGVPSFLYGPLPGGLHRTLPLVRSLAFDTLTPDFGPGRPHRTAGATAVGARPVLVAYNVWVSSLDVARQVAPRVRGPYVRALALPIGEAAQVSCNLIDPSAFGPAQLYDAVAALTRAAGGAVLGAELVGLLPRAVLTTIPPERWPELDLSATTTVEARLAEHPA